MSKSKEATTAKRPNLTPQQMALQGFERIWNTIDPRRKTQPLRNDFNDAYCYIRDTYSGEGVPQITFDELRAQKEALLADSVVLIDENVKLKEVLGPEAVHKILEETTPAKDAKDL